MTTTTSPGRYSAAMEYVSRLVGEGGLPTAVLGVATVDGVVALDAFGTSGTRSIRTGDHFRLFSITKPLIGLIAARELERGTLALDTPLTDALPTFGHHRDDVVRLRHLASHTSGITEPDLDDPRALREALLSAGRDTPVDTLRRYSSLAFEGIAALIEHASGAAWEVGLDRLNATLGTRFTLDEEAGPPPVLGLGGFHMDRFAAQHHPGAGVIARAEDLLAVGTSLLRGDGAVVRPETLELTRRALTVGVPVHEPLPQDDGDQYGFTWKLPGWGAADGVFGHAGWSGTEFWINPTAGLAWTLMTNRPERPGFDVATLNRLVTGDR